MIEKIKQYSLTAAALLVGWFLLVFQLRGRKVARLEARQLIFDESNKQKALDEAVKKAKEEYNEQD